MNSKEKLQSVGFTPKQADILLDIIFDSIEIGRRQNVKSHTGLENNKDSIISACEEILDTLEENSSSSEFIESLMDGAHKYG